MNGTIPVGLLIAVSVWFWVDHGNLTEKVDYLNDEISSLEDKNSSYREALDQTNSNIEDARSYAWESYNEMGEALDNLETIEP